MKPYPTRSKSRNYDLSLMTEVEIFDLVYTKKISKFPAHFWDNEEAKKYSVDILRHLIEDILKWDSDTVKKCLRKETFSQNGLASMLNTVYEYSSYKAITSAYPEREYKPWDFVNAPNNYWQGEDGKINGYQAMKWLIEEKLQWSYDDIRMKLNHKVFTENNLLGMFKKVYHSNLFEAVDALCPGVFKRWEIGEHVANDYWTIEEGNNAVRWLIEEKLHWGDEELKLKLNKEVFIKHGLYGMIQRCFQASPVKAILSAYPGKFNEWDFPCVPSNFWSFENACKATKWLIEEKLHWNKADIKQNLNRVTFKDNKLTTIVEKFKIYDIINAIYPNEFHVWEFPNLPNGIWTIDISVKAIRWLIEEKLGWSKKYAVKHLRQHHLKKYGLSYITKKNKITILELIELAYQEK